MSDALLLYLFTRIDALGNIVLTAFIFSIFATLVSLITWLFCVDMGLERYAKMALSAKGYVRKFLTRAVLPLAILVVIVPSQKDLMFILAGVGVLEVAKSETAQRVAGKSVQVIEQYLDGLIEKTEEAE